MGVNESLASQGADDMEARAIKWAAEHSQRLPASRLGLASLLVDAFIAGAIAGADVIAAGMDTKDAIAAASQS